MMTRRYFLSTTFSLFTLPLFANQSKLKTQKTCLIEMNGDLDDDLYIIKANTFGSSKMLECHQMHNQSGEWLYCGQLIKTNHVPGYIEFNKQFSLLKDEILVVCTANERIERNQRQELLGRSHYKSTSLHVNKSELFPSMIPEKNELS